MCLRVWFIQLIEVQLFACCRAPGIC